MKRVKYIFCKSFFSIIIFFISISISFVLIHMLPGNYLDYLLKDLAQVNPEVSVLFKEKFGLDKPLIVQYIIYLKNIFYGNWGYSLQYARPVLNIINEKLNWTLIILFPSTMLSIFVGIIVGAYMGWKNGSRNDLFITNFMIFIKTIPSYWWAITFILLFSYYIKIFPLGGFTNVNALKYGVNYLDILYHAFLPILTLTLCSIPGHYYLMRNSMLSVIKEPYITVARAKGLPENYILYLHAIKNAILPMLTVISLECAHLFTGSLFIETIFSWPGMGLLTFDAIKARDFPLLQAIFLIETFLIIIANFIADILYLFINPCIKDN
ncbi:ABC transporter permease [Aceticella autotrophica]|uniref:ABC transporter permease n=1 Tax=Aceticella autotrophica TaxID=2755338 RepID=A0A975GA34_9THEO|nr:ABC transporter permease [Aceticella autotrophica]QSZ26780.1 ABC transporter permease [Aceticella autotrophica]QSZ27084.1 ABC transporter permease [Aceticella autotrophica]